MLRFDLYSGKAYPLSLLPNGSIFVSSDCKILLQGFLVMHVGSCKLQPSLKVLILEYCKTHFTLQSGDTSKQLIFTVQRNH